MADSQGAWLGPTFRDEQAAPVPEPAAGLETELGLLEARVAEAALLMRRLREDREGLQRERETLLLECRDLRRDCESLRQDLDMLRREREQTAARLAQIIAKVDALRGEP